VVVAAEYREAVEAVIGGLRDEEARAAEDLRKSKAEKMWKRMLVGLRIIQRVSGYGGVEVEDEDEEEHEKEHENAPDSLDDVESDVSEYIEEEGGGFFPE
jgi:xeroderma pigmentosum group C-complementing protein